MDSILVKFAGLIMTGLKLAGTSIFARLMAGAGMSFVTFTIAYPQVRSFIESKFLSLPAQAQQMMNYCGVTIFMTMVISAIVARAGLQLFNMATTKLDSLVAGAN